MSVHDLSREQRNLVTEELRAAFSSEKGVAFAFLHGSFALDLPFRDVDLAVYFAAGVEHPDERALRLGEHLSGLVRLPVDVRALNTAPLTFRFHAVRGQLLAVSDEALLSDVLEDTMRRYFDVAPVLARAAREAFGS
jgi:predicted nucleotidyltransferase